MCQALGPRWSWMLGGSCDGNLPGYCTNRCLAGLLTRVGLGLGFRVEGFRV